MTNPATQIHHFNRFTFGPTHYYRSFETGKRLAFRANEIVSVRPALFGSSVVTTIGGYEFSVTATRPEQIS
jgi:hypothetical protein